MMKQARKQRKVRYGRVVFLIACLIFVFIGLIRILAKPDPYQMYKEVSNESKLVGEATELFEEISEEKAKFFHYPKFENEAMNKKILAYINSLPDENGITFVDYESKEVLEQYTTVLFHYQLLDMEQKVQKEALTSYTFVNESGEIATLSDVLRRDYVDIVKEQFQKQANITLESLEEVELSIGENALDLIADNQRISLPYGDFKSYMKIPGKGISDVNLEKKRTVEVDPNKPMIAITFDDGPTPFTDDFMNVFEQYNATASFFMLGKNIANYPDSVKHMYEYGFEMCNHSWDHQNISSDDTAFIKQEIFDTQDAIYQLTGHEPTRIRPPYGAYNATSAQIANDNGMAITLWNVDTEDWSNRDKAISLERAKAGAWDGAIILFHDLYPSSLDTIKELIPYLQEQGYQLVTVSDLFKYKGDKTGLE